MAGLFVGTGGTSVRFVSQRPNALHKALLISLLSMNRCIFLLKLGTMWAWVSRSGTYLSRNCSQQGLDSLE